MALGKLSHLFLAATGTLAISALAFLACFLILIIVSLPTATLDSLGILPTYAPEAFEGFFLCGLCMIPFLVASVIPDTEEYRQKLLNTESGMILAAMLADMSERDAADKDFQKAIADLNREAHIEADLIKDEDPQKGERARKVAHAKAHIARLEQERTLALSEYDAECELETPALVATTTSATSAPVALAIQN